MASYLIKYGSEILFQAGNDNRPIHSARLSARTDGVSQLTMTMPPSHPMRHSSDMKLRDLENPVIVTYGSRQLFCGFITRMVEQIDGQLAITCASDAQLLADVHVRLDEGLSGQMVINTCIALYNAQMAALGLQDRQFITRTNIDYYSIGYRDPAKDIPSEHIEWYSVGTSATSPTSILDVLVNAIIKPYNCVLVTWYEADENENMRRYLGIYSPDGVEISDSQFQLHFGSSSQTVRFGENMTTFEYDSSDEGLYTGCYPLGATDRSYDGSEGGKWLNIVTKMEKGSTTLGLAPADGVPFWVYKDAIIIAENVGFTVQVTTEVLATGTLVEVSPLVPFDAPPGGRAWYAGSELIYTDSTVTLSRIPNGLYNSDAYRKTGEIVCKVDMVQRYGLRTFTFSDSDISDPYVLLNRAMAEIESRLHVKRLVSVDAVDMAFYDQSKNHLIIGQTVQVDAQRLGYSGPMRVMAADLDLDNPSATRYTLGEAPATLGSKIQDNKADTEALRDNLVYEVNNVIEKSTIRGLV